MKKIKYKYIFDFFHNFNFLIRQMIKVGVKVKCDKYLGMEGVHFFKMYMTPVTANRIRRLCLVFNRIKSRYLFQKPFLCPICWLNELHCLSRN
jgi:hypothetical protein